MDTSSSSCGEMASTFRRQENVLREMEAAWEPLGSPPKTPLLNYDPESDPFCPLAIARKFNQLQREATARGTQSLIDLRPSAGASKKRATKTPQCPSSRPKSSGGRIEPAAPMHGGGGGRLLAPPALAGATLKLQDGGGLTCQPPLRAKGLPSSAQLREGRERGGGGGRKRAWKKTTTANSSGRDNNNNNKTSSAEQGRSVSVELGAGALKEFAAKLARRDDILQDVWLKMHSGQAFAQVQGQLAQLLGLYRSTSLEVVEALMRHPQLETIADVHANKKGEGMQFYCAAVARDADFADGVPEASEWLGFPARRNPFFLPPKGDDEPLPLPSIGLDNVKGDDLARLRDAQDFVLNSASSPGAKAMPRSHVAGGGGEVGAQAGAESQDGGGGGGGGGGGSGGGGGGGGGGGSGSGRDANAGPLGRSSGGCRKLRGKIRAIGSELASAQDTIRGLEGSLSSLEAERDAGRERAARARQAAACAGKQKMAKRMYRLRGDAAFVEDGLEELEGEITAVRVRLFAERLDVARRRMLKDALAAEVAVKSRALRRKAKKHRLQQTGGFPQIDSTTGGGGGGGDNEDRLEEDRSAATIQARVRGVGARSAMLLEVREHAESDRKSQSETAAAVRIGAVARGRLVRKRAPTKTQPAPESAVAVAQVAKTTMGGGRPLEKDFVVAPGIGASHCAGLERGAGGEVHASTEARGCVSSKENGPPNIASLDTLGVTGVAALFDSLGLGAYTDRIHRRKQLSPTAGDGGGGGSGGSRGPGKMVGVDGAELARIANAADPDAEMQAIGVSARLHRIKLLAALGVRTAGAVETTVAPARDAGPAGVSYVPPVTPIAVTPVAAKAALFMVQSIRREQEAMDEALRSMAPIQAVADLPASDEWGRLGKEERGRSHGQGDAVGLVGSDGNGSQNESSGVVSSKSSAAATCRTERTGTSPAASGLVSTGGTVRPTDGGRALDGVRQTAGFAERRMTAGAGEGGVGLVSMPLRLLPELEEAFSAQVRLSSQVRRVLQCCRVNGRKDHSEGGLGEAVGRR